MLGDGHRQHFIFLYSMLSEYSIKICVWQNRWFVTAHETSVSIWVNRRPFAVLLLLLVRCGMNRAQLVKVVAHLPLGSLGVNFPLKMRLITWEQAMVESTSIHYNVNFWACPYVELYLLASGSPWRIGTCWLGRPGD